MRTSILIIFCFLATLPGAISQSDKTDIYVSPVGSDANPGTMELPLLTLKGARDHVRQIKALARGDVNVWFRRGEYFLNETVVFSLEDSGNDDLAITYSAYPGEKPVFSSGKEIKGWEKVNNDLH
ncbi:unnamed protein product, partial [Chrysoparadoxa australica]